MPSANKELPERAARLLAGLARLGLTPESPPTTDRAAMHQVHTPDYLAFLETGWTEWQKMPNAGAEVVPHMHPQKDRHRYPHGLSGRVSWHLADTSCPLGEHSWAASLRGVDTALAAAQAIRDGAPAAYALCRPPGHHATADSGAGHCLLNNSAIAAQSLLDLHPRIAVLDIDVHHGNGTQEIFYDRPDVLTVSIHTDPSNFYPFFLGYSDETGSGTGQGFNLNLPLPQGIGDDLWLATIEKALARIADFKPGALVLALGLDAHENDPFKGMKVSTAAFTRAAELIRAADFPTVIVQEGGYLSEDLSDNIEAFLRPWI